jgi:hypothetical protein
VIEHRCKRCIWWDDRHRAVEYIPIQLHKTSPGICRKHKPGSLRIGEHFYGVQPITDADDFCGEFRKEPA